MSPEVRSPEDVAVAALRARDVMDYERVVSLADPASVVELHARYCEFYRRPTLEQFARDRSDLAGDALEKVFEATMRHIAYREKLISNTVPGVHSSAELLELDPGDLLLRALRKSDYRLDLIGRMHARGRTVPPGFLSEAELHHYLVLGSVAEEPDVARVTDG